jgi:3-oxoadipate enol-lactonase
VVFLPGYLMDSHLFDAQVAGLQSQYRCVVLDRRGHGESGCPPGPWTMADLVGDVTGPMEHLELGRSHLVGMSLGGAEISRIALQRPKLVRSLVYVDAPADPRLPAGTDFDLDEIAAHGLSDELLELAALVLYSDGFRTDHPDEVTADIARMRTLPRTTLGEWFRINVTTEPVLDQLRAITAPAIVLHGREDLALPLAEAEHVATALGGARLVVIDRAGHVTPREAPDIVTAAIAEFLATVR